MTIQTEIQIVHRHKQHSKFDRNTLLCHLSSLCQDLNKEFIDIDYILDTIEKGLPNSITSKELVNLTAETIASLTTKYYQYSSLAARVLEFYLQKILPSKFSDNIVQLYRFEPDHNKQSKHLISKNLFSAVMMHKNVIDSAIDHSRDFQIDYFGFRTLERSYFLRISEEIHETPQFLFMRVALGIHFENIDKALETYKLMSEKYFIHASPTLFNSGTDFSNLSSCFLVAMNDDSIEGIFKTIYETALISKCAGGIGLHVSNIRSSGTYISGTNGTSSGLVPMLRVFNNTAKYVDQGGNKRPGAFCIYLEPWHSDVFEFLDLRKNHGKEELRARDLFYALWIPDLFMQKVENNEEWCLFSENQCPGLEDAYGEDFKELYEKYESEKKYLKRVKAQKLWHAILVAQTETGNPFLLYKDACNKKSNQKNLGTIKSSNLCCEIVEYSSPDETAVCNLASIALPSFVKEGRKEVDFGKMHEVTKIVIKNLDKIIDVGSYPLDKCKDSNQKHRPVGLGVQGLADLFFMLRMPFGSEESRKLNIQIFETMYHGALEASVELAIEKGKYTTYEGSPVSNGLLQYDLWGKNPTDLWDWTTLKEQISQHGVRNSLLIALMPTASTSQILGYNECFEPITSNIYTRRVLSGEYQVVNKYLVEDLTQLGLWNDDLKDKIVANNGSILNIDNIPKDIKDLYKTVWEMSQKIIIDLAADRAPFVDQSQSMNLFMNSVSFSKLTSMHFYAWKKGLKTGIYYLRTQSASSAIKFTLDAEIFKKRKLESVCQDDDLNQIKEDNKRKLLIEDPNTDYNSVNIYDDTIISCSLKDPENCDSCSA